MDEFETEWEEMDAKILASDLFDEAEKQALIEYLDKLNVNTYADLKKLAPTCKGKLWTDEQRDFFTLFFSNSELGIRKKYERKSKTTNEEKKEES